MSKFSQVSIRGGTFFRYRSHEKFIVAIFTERTRLIFRVTFYDLPFSSSPLPATSSKLSLPPRVRNVERNYIRESKKARERKLSALTFKSSLGAIVHRCCALARALSEDERRSGAKSRGLDNFSCPPSRKLGDTYLQSKVRRRDRDGEITVYKRGRENERRVGRKA